MKFLPAEISFFMHAAPTRRNLRALSKFLVLLLLMIAAYSVLFHVIMLYEGQQHSWLTGVYWTLTVMSTLGFGDITFGTDLGRTFSILVLLSGVIFLLIVLPFTFIQYFYAPWLEAQTHRRVAREVPASVSGHVIVTDYDPVAVTLLQRLKGGDHRSYLIEPDSVRALALHDQGISVVLGDPEDAATYRKLRVADAALVLANGDDYANTNVAFTVRELTPSVPLVALVRAPESLDVIELAGATHVLQLAEMLGRSLARRTLGGDVRANVIGQFGELLIAEAPVTGTPLVGKSLGEGWLRSATDLTLVGIWERGRFEVPQADTVIQANAVLVLAGSEQQLERFAELTAIYTPADAPVMILGGGRVGRAVAHFLGERGIDYRIVEKDAQRVKDAAHYVIGNAAEVEILERAGLQDAPTAIVTTADDAVNIYLTIYCRRLRPDMQIISRATHEHNVSTLHRAGADFVMSYASMGANAVYNILEQDDVVMIAEGLDVFRLPVPPRLAGRSIRDSGIRQATGCSIIAIEHNGQTIINPGPDALLPADPGTELILVGTTESERRFIDRYG